MPTRIIEAMNKMTAQKERVLDELSKVEKLHQQQDLLLNWETMEHKKGTKTVEIRLDKIKIKMYNVSSEL